MKIEQSPEEQAKALTRVNAWNQAQRIRKAKTQREAQAKRQGKPFITLGDLIRCHKLGL